MSSQKSILSANAATFRITNSFPMQVSLIPPPESAARRAYMVPEIRQQLLAALPKATLATFMRVEQAVMDDVARELYYEMSYDRLNLRLHRTAARRRIYCDAVRIVDARAMTITSTLLDGLGIDYRQRKAPNGPRNRMKYLDVFREDIIQLVVPPLRQKCRGIREILLGTGSHNFGPPFWIVRFSSPWPSGNLTFSHPIPPSADIPADVQDYGHIDYVSTVELEVLDGPPARIKPPVGAPTPSETYSVRNRFDLVLKACTPPPPVDFAREWELALTAGPISEGLYRGLNCNTLPIHLGTLAELYTKQKFLGYKDRLNEIHAYNVQPWDLDDFLTLSIVAGHSLTKLDISDYPERELQTSPPGCSFSDLPSILWAVRYYLPNLKALRFNLGGIETAEELCRDMLDESSLQGGTVQDLYVLTSHFETPLFNVLRCLSSITTPTADIEVDHFRTAEGQLWSPSAQIEFCRYLKAQPPKRRTHLSTVDFTASLGITEPLQVLELTYDRHGRPHRHAEAKAAGWSKQIRTAAHRAIQDLVPKYQTGLLDSTEAACRFQAMATDGTPDELLEEAEKLLEAVGKTREAAKAMDVFQAKVEADIQAYVAALKADNKMVKR